MTKLLIDTCVWLDLAKTLKGEETLNLLCEFLDQGEVTLILPQIILAEFDRNKERIILDAGKSLSSHFRKVKEMVTEHAKSESKTHILSELDDIDKKIPTLSENAIISIAKIESIFKNAEIFDITDSIKLRAAQRAIDKKAPFHLSKNSMGDSLIIECYNEYKEQNSAQDFNIAFVTHNINDFSIKNGNQKLPHEDLKEIFNSPKYQYFINLAEALYLINPDLVEDFNYENDWDFGFRSLSEILDVENEIEQKIWYNRHKIREQSVRNGKMKLIDRKDFKIETANSTIIKDVWEGAVEGAEKVERTYGKKNLRFDDFTWGMINGKLSALRWVLGDEWDNLDT
ncbi:PIN domain-containing protein [Flavobacterium sp.]|uniref:PIN domain-containing protein n=1 Tax=Flavobacterium TaxID=237 RepID=UPI0031D2BEBB